LLEITGKEYSKFVGSIDLAADAIFPVSWAGEERSKNWFHLAREYTEKWHHQQQIREPTGQDGIMTNELVYPVMDTFMCGLPYTYRSVVAMRETTVQISIETEIGGNWFLVQKENGWQLYRKLPPMTVSSSVHIPPDIAWKLFTKGISPATAMQQVSFKGNKELAQVALTLVAVMA
jgi:hypothetical protein